MRFLHDLPGSAKFPTTKDDPHAIAAQLGNAIDAARQSLLIQTPYPVFTQSMKQRLVAARKRGVDIGIVTNSLETTDHVIVHAQYANDRDWLRDLGIALWEMKGPRHMHCKSMIIDGRIAMLGSYNFDILSETRNAEVALLIHDRAFARGLGGEIASQIDNAQAVPSSDCLIGFDARTNAVDGKRIREAAIKRLMAPWIKKYL